MHPLIRHSRLAAALACALLACAWRAAADAPPPIALSGILDLYYQYSFNHPPAGAALAGRSFDVKNDSFSLSLAEINAAMAPTKGRPWGFTATATFGKTADLVHATEPGGASTYKYLQQLYGTYVVGARHPVTIDFGKFVTATGYEVIESSKNDNYSRSFLFNYAIPFYHMGLRATTPITPTLTGQLHLVNGWNNVEDDNSGKTLGAQLAWTPNPKWSWTLNWMGGNESTGAGLAPGVDLNVQLLDLLGTWQPTARLKLGVNVDYASAAKGGQAGGHWSGQALYARCQITKPAALALRAEHFEDTDGLRTGAAQNLNEVTATLEYAAGDHLLSRVEFRHDHAGTAFFPSAGGGSRNQDTILFSQVLRF